MLREATDAECERFGIACPENMDTWAIVAESEGEVKGHLAVTFANGVAFGHDTAVWDADPFTATRLWLRARDECRKRGFKTVRVHVVPGEDTEAMWPKLGFKEVFKVLEGEI